jgi:hypothetical protein
MPRRPFGTLRVARGKPSGKFALEAFDGAMTTQGVFSIGEEMKAVAAPRELGNARLEIPQESEMADRQQNFHLGNSSALSLTCTDMSARLVEVGWRHTYSV